MRNYYQVRLGSGAKFAQECISGNFIGANYGIHQDLSNQLPQEWRAFNKKFIPIYLEKHPEKERVAAGLACGALWTIGRGINKGDVVLSPDNKGKYNVGEITGDYYYQEGANLPHCRPVQWWNQQIERSSMSTALQSSTTSWTTVINISKYTAEIEHLLGIAPAPAIIVNDETVEDISAFAMEKHLEDFLVKNWSQTELAKEFRIFEVDGQLVGQQFPTDTGPIDILAESKDKKTLLVVELKKGRASDAVVGQILRYMGFVKEELAGAGQSVRGIVIALEDDQRLRRALSMAPNVDFYRYQISFKLVKA
jgi:restriction system protein